MSDRANVGGQAVIEGVMMRSPRALAVAVRRPDGTIVARELAWISLLERVRFLRWPLLRGVIILVESMWNGLSALQFAAGLQHGGASAPPRSMLGTIVTAFAIAMAMFVGLPHLLAWLASAALGFGIEALGFHALDGLFKLAIFVGYIWGVGQIPEIARVFQYHGAEHKAVNCYERGLPLTLETAKAQTTFHARCGTSFILFVLTLSIFVFALTIPLFPVIEGPAIVQHLAIIALKIPLMAPLAGIAYEINRYAAKNPDRAWVQAFVWPGRMMQRLTTREPTVFQIEIALVALETTLLADARAARANEEITVYKSYLDFRHAKDAAAC